MPTLPTDLRRDLDKAVVQARELAEAAARAALERLGAEAAESPPGLDEDGRRLRTALRERAKALGGGARILGFDQLVEEIAYEQWHRMLFARFLAENHLLLTPGGAPVSLADVRDLAAEEGERDSWVLAARYAAAMLPGIFRADDPANRVSYAPEDRQRLETVLESLPASVFTADDALGWVYQFWQSKKKDEVNKKGDKIGGADLPPVTQLFTEDYMVRFLLENSLGAWWAGRHPDSPLLKDWEYLRFRDDGTPAAGAFEGWPTTAAEVTVMDPCCGSGHFLVAAADMLRKMRIEEEGLSETDAASAVIADNLYGLELDPRCLQLAAFNLALDAWKAGGYQALPLPNLACSGIAIKGQRDDWHRLAAGDDKMEAALDRLYDLFQDAPELGSLIHPRAAAGEGLWAVDVKELLARLAVALQREAAANPAAAVFGAAAKGTAQAAQLLSGQYWLVATNSPFLSRSKQSERMRSYLATSFEASRGDLATGFLERCVALTVDSGTYELVTPINWIYLGAYELLRRKLLPQQSISFIVRLGSHAFDAVSGEIVSVLLLIGLKRVPVSDHRIAGIDALTASSAAEKSSMLVRDPVQYVDQGRQSANPDSRIIMDEGSWDSLLNLHADSRYGLRTGDFPRFGRCFWEVHLDPSVWSYSQSTVSNPIGYGGREHVLRWENGGGALRDFADEGLASIQGADAWGQLGVAVSLTGSLASSIYTGEIFDNNVAAVWPLREEVMLPLLAYCSSNEFSENVRRIDQSLKVTNQTLLKVPLDFERWQKVATEKYPRGLPEQDSDDPTQWLFKGTVVGTDAPLQVAVARLLGYRWPDQEPDELDALADSDGLVPLPSVGGERPAGDRLRALLARAYGGAWSGGLLDRLLAEAGSEGKTLETWLREDFFKQHIKLFHNRPFIWHIWDGRKDGFNVLVHYHRLDKRLLERLTFTVLGDWIERQRAAGEEPGADARLASASKLQDKFKLILAGEPDYDIYVRWKPVAEQPMGWEPDLDDGVRLNIRPFMEAGILRSKPSIRWTKDRGKDPDGSERHNDLHLTLTEKRAAREEVAG